MYFDTRDIYTTTSRSRGDWDDRIQDTYAASLSGGYHLDFGALEYTPSVGLTIEDIDFSQRKYFPSIPCSS